MLSLPPIIPRDGHNLWYTPRHVQSTAPQSGTLYPEAHQINHSMANPTGSSRRTPENPTYIRSNLSLLNADEANIKQRKKNIRWFGAGWLRPPGVPKTYQAIMDEAMERKDQELAAQRDALMEEMMAAQADEGRLAALEQPDGQAGAAGATAGTETIAATPQAGAADAGERDLDEDVPDADDISYVEEEDDSFYGELDSDEEIEEDDDGDRTGLMMDETDVMGMDDSGNETARDLDEDIQEAGSLGLSDEDDEMHDYDDTEGEETDDDEDDDNFPEEPSYVSDVLPVPPSSAVVGSRHLPHPFQTPQSPRRSSPRDGGAPPNPVLPFRIPRFSSQPGHPSGAGMPSQFRLRRTARGSAGGDGVGYSSTGTPAHQSGGHAHPADTPGSIPFSHPYVRMDPRTFAERNSGLGFGLDLGSAFAGSPAPGRPLIPGRMMGTSGLGFPYGPGSSRLHDSSSAAAAAAAAAAMTSLPATGTTSGTGAGPEPESPQTTRRRQAVSAAAGVGFTPGPSRVATTHVSFPLSPGGGGGPDMPFTPGASVGSATGGPITAGGIVFEDDFAGDVEGHSPFWSGRAGGGGVGIGGGAMPGSSSSAGAGASASAADRRADGRGRPSESNSGLHFDVGSSSRSTTDGQGRSGDPSGDQTQAGHSARQTRRGGRLKR